MNEIKQLFTDAHCAFAALENGDIVLCRQEHRGYYQTPWHGDEALVDRLNADIGLTQEKAAVIVLSSMREGPTLRLLEE